MYAFRAYSTHTYRQTDQIAFYKVRFKEMKKLKHSIKYLREKLKTSLRLDWNILIIRLMMLLSFLYSSRLKMPPSNQSKYNLNKITF